MKTCLVIALFAGLSTSLASASDIVGTVTLNGTPPPEVEITPAMQTDPNCGKLHTEKVFTRFYVVGPNQGLADVVVMLKGITGKSTGASEPPAVLDQKGCMYEPQIMAIQTNQKLLVRNSDPGPILHNVHANWAVAANAANNTENQVMMAGAGDLSYAFPAPEDFLKFNCDVHRWMFAWVTVVDSPYFAVTDQDGKFTIKNVPPGKYTVAAMHRKLSLVPDTKPPQYKGLDKEIEVKDGAPATVDFTFDIK